MLLPTILSGAALLAAFVMCWERPAGAAVLWERDHGSWRVSMESDRLGARAPKTCRLQTSFVAKGAAPSTVAFPLGGGTGVLVLSWLNPMVPLGWQPQPSTPLFSNALFGLGVEVIPEMPPRSPWPEGPRCPSSGAACRSPPTRT